MGEYDRMMANRPPNPEMRTCQFCHGRTAVGQKCCSWNYKVVGTAIPRPTGRRYERGTNQGKRAKPQKPMTGWPKILALREKQKGNA